MPTLLPPCPVALVVSGAPQFGLWQGSIGNASFADLRAPYARKFLSRKLIEKKWIYTLVATPELFLCLAIIDAGPIHSCFLGLFDRAQKKLIADINVVLPGLFARVSDQPSSLFATLSAPGTHASIEKLGAGAQVHVRIGDTTVDLRLDSIAEPLPVSACADLGDARFDFTQKRAGLTAHGTVVHARRSFRVEGGRAGLDFTHGFLQRKTAWRWAFGMGEAQGRKLAFNLSEGFLKTGSENILFLDGEPLSLGPVHFSFDSKNSSAPWNIRGDGLELVFTPEGNRSQNVWTPLMSSRYVQPFGAFAGHLTTPSGSVLTLAGIDGVTEDHAAKW